MHSQLPQQEWHFDIDNMKPNPGVHIYDRLRASFVQHLKARSMVHYDAANLFGMIPLKRLGAHVPLSQEYEAQELFQLVITTHPESITWKMIRTIEAIFYLHPNAKVVVYSNTIPERDSKLDIFKEVGYDLEIQPYSFESFLDSADNINNELKLAFLTKLEDLSKNQHWYTHEADLVKLFVLERNGGVVLDVDMQLIKAFPKTFVNVAAWKSQKNDKVGTALLAFEKNSKFLKVIIGDAIDIAVHHYDRGTQIQITIVPDCHVDILIFFSLASLINLISDSYNIFGSDLVTEHFLDKQRGNTNFKVLSYKTFYPFENESDCVTISKEILNPLDEVNTFAIHINAIDKQGFQIPLQKGSLCDSVLHDVCILCGDLFEHQNKVKY